MAGRFSTEEIVKATGGLLAGAAAADARGALIGVSTDTRILKGGEAFFALKGENHDAHDHLSEAAVKGAALLVVSDTAGIPDGYKGIVVTVKDTLRAYQELAAYYRQKVDPLVIAVTGSVGKTTVKDMMGCILTEPAHEGIAGPGRVHRTQGNINNQIGLPRTILEADEDTQILVLEMGLAYAGDIERLCEIARPDIAVITNVGLSHRENFDSDEGILYAKYEVTAFLGEGCTLIIDAGGNENLDKLASDGSGKKGYRLLRVALEDTKAAGFADYIVTKTRVSPEDAGVSLFEIRKGSAGKAIPFAIPLPGPYAGVNAALASAACVCAGVSLEDAAKALKSLKRTGHRLDPIAKNGILVIDDTYNASPDSVISGLEYLKNVIANKRIAVLADMNELGDDSEAKHREVGAAAVLSGADLIYAYGEKAGGIADGAGEAAAGLSSAKIYHYAPGDKKAMISRLKKDAGKGSAVYVKGSRAMKMEEVVAALTGDACDTEEKHGAN